MAFEILQRESHGAGPEGHNEDRCGARGKLAWVIDGATDIHDGPLTGDRTDAAWLASTADALLADGTGAEAPSLGTVVDNLTGEIAAHFAAEASRPPRHRWEHPAAAALFVRLEANQLEWLSIGDCALVTRSPHGGLSTVNVGGPNAGDRIAAEKLRQRAAEVGAMSAAERRRLMQPQLRAYRQRAQNLPGGYAVLSIDRPPAELIVSGAFDIAPGAEILLATDGLMRLIEVFDRYDAESLLDAATSRGVAALLGELRAIEEADSDCTEAPRLKTSDDATGLLVRVAR